MFKLRRSWHLTQQIIHTMRDRMRSAGIRELWPFKAWKPELSFFSLPTSHFYCYYPNTINRCDCLLLSYKVYAGWLFPCAQEPGLFLAHSPVTQVRCDDCFRWRHNSEDEGGSHQWREILEKCLVRMPVWVVVKPTHRKMPKIVTQNHSINEWLLIYRVQIRSWGWN